MATQPSSRTTALLVGVALLVLAAAGYFFLISPKRSESARLQGEIETTRAAVERLRTEQAASGEAVELAPLFRLTKAMPDHTDMAEIVLELDRIAGGTGVRFTSINPQVPVAKTGYSAVPIQVAFEGDFDELTRFLQRLRTQVDVKRGTLRARGRLYTVDTVDLSEGERKFPSLRATLTLGAFLYGGGAPPLPAPAETGAGGGQAVATGATP